jgi:predicted naringenin-chalcone synthase
VLWKERVSLFFHCRATSTVQIFAQKREQLFASQSPETAQPGNLSSASVLTVMQDFLPNHPGTPAFCSELLLLQW